MSKLLAKTLVWTKAGVAYSTPRLANFWRLAKVELRPPTPSEVGVAIKDAQKGLSSQFLKLISRIWCLVLQQFTAF